MWVSSGCSPGSLGGLAPSRSRSRHGRGPSRGLASGPRSSQTWSLTRQLQRHSLLTCVRQLPTPSFSLRPFAGEGALAQCPPPPAAVTCSVRVGSSSWKQVCGFHRSSRGPGSPCRVCGQPVPLACPPRALSGRLSGRLPRRPSLLCGAPPSSVWPPLSRAPAPAGLFSVPCPLLPAQSRAGARARPVCQGQRPPAVCARGAEPPLGAARGAGGTRRRPCFLELGHVVMHVPLLFLEA